MIPKIDFLLIFLQFKKWPQQIWAGWSSATIMRISWRNVTSRNHSARYVQTDSESTSHIEHDDFLLPSRSLMDHDYNLICYAEVRFKLDRSTSRPHSIEINQNEFFAFCRNWTIWQMSARSVTMDWCTRKPSALSQLLTRKDSPSSWRPRRIKYVFVDRPIDNLYIFSCNKMMQLLTESQMMTTFTTHFYWFQFKTTHFHFILVQCVDLMKFFSSIICRTNQQRTSTKSFSSKELAAHWANFVIRLCTATTVTILNR